MTPEQKFTAARIIKGEIAARENQNKMIRDRFGDRITTALMAECGARDLEIASLEATAVLIEAASPQ